MFRDEARGGKRKPREGKAPTKEEKIITFVGTTVGILREMHYQRGRFSLEGKRQSRASMKGTLGFSETNKFVLWGLFRNLIHKLNKE